MAYMWSTCSFAYYMIGLYVKYIPGNIYVNSIASGSSDLVANLVAGLVYEKLGIKLTFVVLFALSLVGGICLIVFGTDSGSLMIGLFVILAKFGISGGFTIVYVCMVDLFPTLFVAKSMGVCNFCARLLTILAPQVAEV